MGSAVNSSNKKDLIQTWTFYKWFKAWLSVLADLENKKCGCTFCVHPAAVQATRSSHGGDQRTSRQAPCKSSFYWSPQNFIFDTPSVWILRVGFPSNTPFSLKQWVFYLQLFFWYFHAQQSRHLASPEDFCWFIELLQ